jgi:hypothetical protein
MKRLAFLLVAVSLLTSGCAWFDDPSPEEARVFITGDPGKQVRLIISTRFVASVNEQGITRVVIIEADTTLITLPHDHVYSIGEDQRFFVEAARQDADFQSLRMEVYIDSRRQFEEGGPLLTDQPYRFVYTFNQAITREIVVI